MNAAAAAKRLSPFGHALSGSGGAVLALAITYPLDVIKTRLQVQTNDSAFTTHYNSMMDALMQIVRNEGIEGLYAGLPSGIIGTASTNFAYFYWYTLIRGSYVKVLQKNAAAGGLVGADLQMALQIGTLMELLLGALAGACAQIMTIPVSVVTTRQQTQIPVQIGVNKSTGEPVCRRKGMVETARDIVRDEGVTGLWKGLRPALVLTINPAITYGMFERLKTIMLTRKAAKMNTKIESASLTSLDLFLLGLFSKTLATVVTYPYIMAKVRLQWKAKDYETNERVRYKGALDVLWRVLQSEGLTGWYKGMKAQISKAVMSQALLFVIKDRLTLYTYLLFKAIKGGSN